MDGVYTRRVGEAARRCAAHALLFTFTLLLLLKLDNLFSGAWWRVFTPLWLLHAFVARGRFSIPAPSDQHDCHWPPFHAVVATPLILAFEVLLCMYLEISSNGVNLKIVFLPVVFLEIIIIVDNFRMLFRLLLEEVGDSNGNVTWQKITHCLIILSMSFILGATLFMVLMLTGYTATVNWWWPYSVFSVGQCFAFPVCTKWTYPMIHGYSQTRVHSSLVSEVVEDQKNAGSTFSLQDIGGHVTKVLVIAFQLLLCMHLQGTPSRARKISFWIILSPLLLLQGVGALVSTLQFFERLINLPLPIGDGKGRYFRFSSRAQDVLEFILDGSRLLGWWSIDEAEPRILYDCELGCYTLYTNPPGVVKNMSKRDLVEEVWTLQVALNDLIKTPGSIKREYERLQKKKVLCKVCLEREIEVVLLPCKHLDLCRSCYIDCKKCPTCRNPVNSRILVAYAV